MDNLFRRIRGVIQNLFNRDKKIEAKYKPIEPKQFELFSPFKLDELNKLISVSRRVNSNKPLKVNDIILRSVLELASPTLKLFQLAPAVWKGEQYAIDEFDNLIDETIKKNQPDQNVFLREAKLNISLLDRPNLHKSKYNAPLFFVKPEVIHSIQMAALYLARGNNDRYIDSLAAIDVLREQMQSLDYLNTLANSKDPQKEFDEGFNGVQQMLMLSGNPDEFEDFDNRDSLNKKGLLNPPIKDPWSDDLFNFERPPLGPTGAPEDPLWEIPREFFDARQYCDAILQGPNVFYEPLPISIVPFARSGISVSPSHLCSGDTMTVTRIGNNIGVGFGSTQGHNSLIIGNTPAEIISWSDEKIVAKVPDGLNGTFCVAIRNEDSEEERRQVHQNNLGYLDHHRETLNFCFGFPIGGGRIPFRPSVAPCGTGTQIKIGAPQITRFTINHSEHSIVNSGGELTLRWTTKLADSISITRIGSSGPNVNISSPLSGTKNIGAFNTNSQQTITYRLTATNKCGSVQKEIKVTSTTDYSLEILGIEVNQAIQKFDWNNPGNNNSVRLISRKRTMVRVFAKCTGSSGFNFGFGADKLKVTGKLKLTYPNGNINNITIPLNPDGEIIVGLESEVDRENLDDSLNFDIPVTSLHGTCNIEAELETILDVNNQITSQDTQVTFQSGKEVELVLVRIKDTINDIPEPTLSSYLKTLREARGRLPVGENDVSTMFYPSIEVVNTREHTTIFGNNKDEDLTIRDGWSRLLARLDDIADDYSNDGKIWVGLTPEHPSYDINGVANSGQVTFWFDDNPRMLTRDGFPATFAHELGHTVSIKHAKSVSTSSNPLIHSCGDPENTDSSLASVTEDVGVQPRNYRIMPKGIPDFMTYCSPEISAPSRSIDPINVGDTTITGTGGILGMVIYIFYRASTSSDWERIGSALITDTNSSGQNVWSLQLQNPVQDSNMSHYGTTKYRFQDRWISINQWNKLYNNL